MSDFPIAPTLFADNPYDERWYDQDFMHTRDGIRAFPRNAYKATFNLSLPFVRSFRNAIDVGCRDGAFSRYIQKHFGHIYCFDPNLSPNFKFNVPLSKVTHFRCALGEQAGTITMTGGQHVIDPQHRDTREVACLVLDDFGLTDIDYMKIDTDGYDRRVLIGGEKTIERWRPIIVTEQADFGLPGEEPFGSKAWLEERGYSQAAHRDEDFVMVPREKL